MRSFQTLVTLVTLMLFVSKEAAALPVPAPNTVGSSNIYFPTSTNSARDLEDRFFIPLPIFRPPAPLAAAGNTATTTLTTTDNQVGVTSGDASDNSVYVGFGNINPTSTNSARELEDRFFIPLPIFQPPAPPAPAGNTATTTLNTSGNKVGVTSGDGSINSVHVGSGNINPTSTNTARELEDRFFIPLPIFQPPAPPAPAGNTATTTLNTSDNKVGVASGNGSINSVNVGQGNINPTSNNSARDLEDRFFIPLPIFRPPAPPAPAGNTATTTLNTSNNQVGVASGNGSDNRVTVVSGNINPTSTNSARELEDRFFIPLPIFQPPAPPAPAGNTATTTLNTSNNQVGVASGNASDNHIWVGSGNINPTSTNSAREVD